MYDLEILVPAELHLNNRMNDFKKWGLLNFKDRKVKLVLAASFDNDPNFYNYGWTPNLDVEVVVTPYKHVAQRIHYYYDSIAKPDTAKWYFRIDEDSINDIDGLMQNLEKYGDHERDYHFCGMDVLFDDNNVERRILTDLGFGEWYHFALPPHEYEMSVTSNAAMKKILTNPISKKYFNIRKDVADGYGDHGLAHAARMNKVYISPMHWMTVHPDLTNHSLFGGVKNHIHWCSRDHFPSILNWLDLIGKKDDNFDKSKNHLFENKIFLLVNKHDSHKRIVKFQPDNFVDEIFLDGHLERRFVWAVNQDEKLTIFLDGEPEQNNVPFVFEEHKKENSIEYKSKNLELKTGSISDLFR